MRWAAGPTTLCSTDNTWLSPGGQTTPPVYPLWVRELGSAPNVCLDSECLAPVRIWPRQGHAALAQGAARRASPGSTEGYNSSPGRGDRMPHESTLIPKGFLPTGDPHPPGCPPGAKSDRPAGAGHVLRPTRCLRARRPGCAGNANRSATLNRQNVVVRGAQATPPAGLAYFLLRRSDRQPPAASSASVGGLPSRSNAADQ